MPGIHYSHPGCVLVVCTFPGGAAVVGDRFVTHMRVPLKQPQPQDEKASASKPALTHRALVTFAFRSIFEFRFGM